MNSEQAKELLKVIIENNVKMYFASYDGASKEFLTDSLQVTSLIIADKANLTEDEKNKFAYLEQWAYRKFY